MQTDGVLIIYLARSPDHRSWVATLHGDQHRVGIGATKREAVAALFASAQRGGGGGNAVPDAGSTST